MNFFKNMNNVHRVVFQVNTYQVAISSNGTHSFVELLYPENGIQWIQGESHPNGLPDAKAQAGFMSEGKMYTLRGSGTDQIQNVDKWVMGRAEAPAVFTRDVFMGLCNCFQVVECK